MLSTINLIIYFAREIINNEANVYKIWIMSLLKLLFALFVFSNALDIILCIIFLYSVINNNICTLNVAMIKATSATTSLDVHYR